MNSNRIGLEINIIFLNVSQVVFNYKLNKFKGELEL